MSYNGKKLKEEVDSELVPGIETLFLEIFPKFKNKCEIYNFGDKSHENIAAFFISFLTSVTIKVLCENKSVGKTMEIIERSQLKILQSAIAALPIKKEEKKIVLKKVLNSVEIGCLDLIENYNP